MEVRIPLDTSHRGAWEPVEVAVEARDLPGFCVAAVALPCPGILRVLPEAREIPVSAIAAGSGGEGRLHAPLRRRSEELFETRRYVPGDDPRRINWKLFARWNELLVRIGEEVPPPQSKVLCYLYTGPASPRGATGGSAGGRGARDAALDRAVSTFAGVCRVLARRGVDVIYGYGGVEQRGSLGRTGEREFLAELAGVDWDAGARPERAAENTVPARVPALVVAPQETAGVEDLVSELRRRHTGVETYFVPADDANAATPPPLWERLLFRPQPGRPQHGGDRAARAGTGILHRSAGGAR
jgi:hypothetical protein